METILKNNPIRQISSLSNQKFIQSIKENFTEYEKQQFICLFFVYLNYDEKMDFVIDLENVWKWLGFNQKIKSKILLEKLFTIDVDYKCDGEIILMSLHTFKIFCFKINTQKSILTYNLFLLLENLLKETINREKQQENEKYKNMIVPIESTQKHDFHEYDSAMDSQFLDSNHLEDKDEGKNKKQEKSKLQNVIPKCFNWYEPEFYKYYGYENEYDFYRNLETKNELPPTSTLPNKINNREHSNAEINVDDILKKSEKIQQINEKDFYSHHRRHHYHHHHPHHYHGPRNLNNSKSLEENVNKKDFPYSSCYPYLYPYYYYPYYSYPYYPYRDVKLDDDIKTKSDTTTENENVIIVIKNNNIFSKKQFLYFI
jgi:hypothetical protein